MLATHNSAPSPIRVAVFSSGPTLRRSIQRFICQLEEHPQIDLLAVYCQSPGRTLRAVAGDLWRRRKLLAGPLLLVQLGEGVLRYLRNPRREFELKHKMESLSDRIRFVPDIHAEIVLEELRQLAPDLGLIYGSPILKPELFQIPAAGTLGIHHGKVPEYRGKKTTFWALHNGEPTAGVTIQKVNAGLDTGEIVKQGEVPAAGRSLRAVWQELEPLGYELYIQAILEVKEGNASLQPQRGKKGTLYRDPRFSDVLRFFWRRAASTFERRGNRPVKT